MKKKPATPGVCGLICTKNREFFVVSSEDIEKCLVEHIALLNRNQHVLFPRLQCDWNDYGESAFAILRSPCPSSQRESVQKVLVETLQALEQLPGYNQMPDIN